MPCGLTVKKYFIFLYSFLSLSLFSQVVMTSCIENMHEQKCGCEATLYCENKLLESFFNEGLIVTTLPYTNLSFEKWNKLEVSNFAIEDEPDYFIMLYFSYENQKKYNEFTRKNILPCKSIHCKILKKKVNLPIYDKEFVLDEIKDAGIYKKLDFCIEKIKIQIMKKIRGNL